MRTLLFITFMIPLTCFGIGLDSCRMVGKNNGMSVTLDWVYIGGDQFEGYRLKESPIYGFCAMGVKNFLDVKNKVYFMSCYTTYGGKKTVYYEMPKGDNSSTYICTTGCGKDVVEKFILECDGD